jgi:hypothetical protein
MMLRRHLILFVASFAVLGATGLRSASAAESLSEQALAESLQPYHALTEAETQTRYQQPWPTGYSYMTHILRRHMVWPYTGFFRPVWAASQARAMHPPWFDFQPVAGAARYRLSVLAPSAPQPLSALTMDQPDPALRPDPGLPVTTLGHGPVAVTNLLVLVPSLPSAPELFEALDPLGGGAKVQIKPGLQLSASSNRQFQALSPDWLAGESIAADKIPGAQPAGKNVFRGLYLAGALACPSNQVIRLSTKEGWPYRIWLNGVRIVAGQEIKLGAGTYPLTVIVGSDAERIPTTVSLVVEPSSEANWQKAAEAAVAWQAKNKPVVEFEADVPWAPLTPIWAKLPPGRYRIQVAALDGKGTAMGPAMTVSTHKFDPVGESYDFAKVAPWSGPVTNPPSPAAVAQAAQDLIRWKFADPGTSLLGTQTHWLKILKQPELTQAQAQGLTGGGDNLTLPYSIGGGGHMAYTMLSLTAPNAEDRTQWQDVAKRTQSLLETTAAKGFVGYYKDHHFLKHVFGEALLDLYAVTKEERLAEMARELAKQLAAAQTPEGVWRGCGHQIEFSNPAELLYFFGRLRRDLGVQDYLAVEKKADAWLKQNSLRTMFWLAQGHHSYTVYHPFTTAPRCALYYAQYQLECAPAEIKDPAVVRKLLQYVEDQHLAWQPNVALWGMNRDDLDSRAGMALLAKCYLLADLQFGRPLDKAKAETLLAHLVAITPKPGSSVPNDAWDWAQPQIGHYLLDCSRLMGTRE